MCVILKFFSNLLLFPIALCASAVCFCVWAFFRVILGVICGVELFAKAIASFFRLARFAVLDLAVKKLPSALRRAGSAITCVLGFVLGLALLLAGLFLAAGALYLLFCLVTAIFKNPEAALGILPFLLP